MDDIPPQRTFSSGEQSPSSEGRTRAKFRRSKDGCLTCRRRRKRCDLDPGPACKTCQRLKLTCEWPDPLARGASNARSVRSTPQPRRPDAHPQFDPLGLLASALGMHEAPTDPAPAPPPLVRQDVVQTGVENASVDLIQSFPFSDILGGFEIDNATLQLWAADCLQPQPQPGSGSGGLPAGALDMSWYTLLDDPVPSDFEPASAPSASSDSVLSPTSASTRGGRRHADLLQHFQTTLSSLVTCSGDANGFSAFTDLADRSTSLYLSILAWAGRHMANMGAARYEAISERLGAEAGVMVLAELEKVAQPGSAGRMDDEDAMTVLATALMVIQFRICRGDVWGFDVLVERGGLLASSLFERVDSAHNVRAAQFLDNLIYHDVLSSFAYTRGPMVPYELILKHTQGQLSALHTLTGVNLPVFCKMYRGEALLEVLGSAEQLEDELEAERQRVEALVQSKPHLGVHRYYHEAFRTATLVQIRGFVLCESPCSLKLRLLVRQSLTHLEAMIGRNLAGVCSIHWVLFIIGVMALPGEPGDNDRERVDKLYDDFAKRIGGFLNVPRSRALMHEVWARNQEGRAFVDWLDIVLEYDWEMYFTLFRHAHLHLVLIAPSTMASPPPPPARRSLRLTLPVDALSPFLTFYPPLAWQYGSGLWHLVNPTGAGISHTFAGERWALSGNSRALVIAGNNAQLTIDGVSSTKKVDGGDHEIVAATAAEGWHEANYTLSGYRGELDVSGATSELGVLADVSEDEFKALEQRVPIAEHGDNLVFNDGSTAVDVAQGRGGLVLAIPSNSSLFAVSGTHGPSGSVQLAFTPPVLGRSEFAANMSLAVPSNETQTTLFTAPLDPEVQYTVSIEGIGVRLSAMHYWPVASDSFSWRQEQWTPPTSLLTLPSPSTPKAQTSLAEHRRSNIGAIVGGAIGGAVILAVMIMVALCECRRVRLLHARYRPRRGVSKRGISSSDLTRFEEHYFSVRSTASHDSHDRERERDRAHPTPFVEYNAYARGLSRTPTLSHAHMSQLSPASTPTLSSSVPFSPALGRPAKERRERKAKSKGRKVRLPAEMYARPSLTDSGSVDVVSVEMPRPLPTSELHQTPPLPMRPSYEHRVRAFMGVLPVHPHGVHGHGHPHGHTVVKPPSPPVTPSREQLQPSPAPVGWEPDTVSVYSGYSGATIGKAL
ncbi:hypothetical protein CspeluHIS016_0407880 [Cutaneotrichosporon spelunceum]|uniref:Zn(2)-C6 fungal-type domain-containing protein n=1 Tax=Cutaneotrichosporon spelunceum TaxID=1672016 RepID=A0AAD3YDI7_9TREE|nr:hypothetical protein CspeluHIS016_0407880 [Cutaneotrichosporon spelunceum]